MLNLSINSSLSLWFLLHFISKYWTSFLEHVKKRLFVLLSFLNLLTCFSDCGHICQYQNNESCIHYQQPCQSYISTKRESNLRSAPRFTRNQSAVARYLRFLRIYAIARSQYSSGIFLEILRKTQRTEYGITYYVYYLLLAFARGFT